MQATVRTQDGEPSQGKTGAQLPSTPAICAHEPSVLDEEIPAPRHRRRFFSHAAVDAAQRYSKLAAFSAFGYAGLSVALFGFGGSLPAMTLIGLTGLPCVGLGALTSAMLGARRRRLRVEARTLLCAAEERLPEADPDLGSVRGLAALALRPLSPKEMQQLEAQVDYFGDVIRRRRL